MSGFYGAKKFGYIGTPELNAFGGTVCSDNHINHGSGAFSVSSKCVLCLV